ncbi:unnamed protein product [Calypogeia fissa]
MLAVPSVALLLLPRTVESGRKFDSALIGFIDNRQKGADYKATRLDHNLGERGGQLMVSEMLKGSLYQMEEARGTRKSWLGSS